MKKKLLIKSIALAIVVVALISGFIVACKRAFQVSMVFGIIFAISPLLLAFFCFLVSTIYDVLDDDIH